jgi:hypothetical protein
LTLKRGRFSLLIGNERLASEHNIAFQAPLSTLHKFQGFTDQFLMIPIDGLRDQYATVRANIGSGRIEFTAHEFETDSNCRDMGKEYSVGAWHRIGTRSNGDVRKYWLHFTHSI